MNVYCKAPWTSISFMPGGKYTPCCAWSGEHFDTPEQVLEQVGGAFLRGEVPEPCQRACPSEGPGWKNSFLQYNTDYQQQQIQMLDFRNNNLCNLKCRSCSPKFSSSWASEYGNQTINLHQPITLPNLDLSRCVEIYFAGGEPLLNPQHYELLDLILEKRLKPRLMYSTNCTVLNYKQRSVQDIWPKFPHVTVSASIDAVGPYAEIVRSGTDWSAVESNLAWMREQKNVQLFFSPVISAINIWWIDKLFEYFDNNGYNEINPVLANIEGQEGLGLIPHEFRPELIAKLKTFKSVNVNIDRAIAALETVDTTDKWWQFVSQQLILDNYRKESWFANLPIQHKLYQKAYHYYG